MTRPTSIMTIALHDADATGRSALASLHEHVTSSQLSTAWSRAIHAKATGLWVFLSTSTHRA